MEDADGRTTVAANGGVLGKLSALSSWRQFFTLRGFFRRLGWTIGRYPHVYLLVTFCISLLSGGMYFMVLKDRIRDGYTPLNAPSRRETEIFREFWGTKGEPMMSVVIAMAKDGGSMLRDEHLAATVDIYHYFMDDFNFTVDGETFVFNQLCEPYCDINFVFPYFKKGQDAQKSRQAKGQPLAKDTFLSYPISTVDGIKIHLERNFYGVRSRVNQSHGVTDDSSDSNSTALRKIVNLSSDAAFSSIEYVELLLIIFRADKSSEAMDKRLAVWENAAFDYIMNNYSNPHVDMQVVGVEILDREMIRDGQRMTPYFAAGFTFMAIFVTITVIGSAIYYDELDAGKCIVAAGATLSPVLAITTTFGLISLLGFRTNSFMLVMPFLVMAIGVDDAFLMIHSWQRLALHRATLTKTVPDRLGLVFEEVGPSVTITSLTNAIAFGIGALTPTPEIRLFCMATAIAMSLDYLFQLILFGPALAFAAHCESKDLSSLRDRNNRDSCRKKLHEAFRSLLRVYCRLLSNSVVFLLIVILTLIYWFFAIYGAMSIEARLDTQKILPRDSPILRTDKILSEIVWNEYHPVTVLVNNPPDIRNATQLKYFKTMVREYESLDRATGNGSTTLWLTDYEQFYTENQEFMDAFGIDNENAAGTDATGLDYDLLPEFLESPYFKHWVSFVRWKRVGETNVVESFMFRTSYHNTSSWDARIDLMQKWREIARRYSDRLNVTVWEANAMFVDQILSLKGVTLQTVAVTLVCMAVVCAIFMPSPCSVLTASIAIASISLGVFGSLSWWNFDLDPITMAATLMSIGLSVDFTAHVSYHYQLTGRANLRRGENAGERIIGKQARLEHTLGSVGWPMLQAGLSTVVCVLPLALLQSYSPMVFFKTMFLVVAWGLAHGLLVLPAFLAALPECLTGKEVCPGPSTHDFTVDRQNDAVDAVDEHELEPL